MLEQNFRWIIFKPNFVTNTSNFNFNFDNGSCDVLLMPSASKPLPEPMLTQTYVAVWCHQTTMRCHFHIHSLLPKLFTPQPSGLEGYCHHGPGGRAGGWAGGCQTCRTHILVTAWWIFSIRSSVEFSRPLVVHCHGHLPICPIWACPWAKNLSNLAQIGSRLCGTQISETAGWIYPI